MHTQKHTYTLLFRTAIKLLELLELSCFDLTLKKKKLMLVFHLA